DLCIPERCTCSSRTRAGKVALVQHDGNRDPLHDECLIEMQGKLIRLDAAVNHQHCGIHSPGYDLADKFESFLPGCPEEMDVKGMDLCPAIIKGNGGITV